MDIIVLTNEKGEFYSSVKYLKKTGKLSLDMDKLIEFGNKHGLNFILKDFSEVDFRKFELKNQVVLYTSSEDPMLYYKGYIHDVVKGIEMMGGILVPRLDLFEAHHNKVFMEILRDILLRNVDTGVKTRHFGTYESYIQRTDEIEVPCVIKTAFGAGSKGVALIRSEAEKTNKPKSMSKAYSNKELVKKIVGKYSPFSLYRNKFVIQNFIENLSGDFKVLVYGEKYFVISRANRENDFRASGGGKLDFDPQLPKGIFDFAKEVYESLDTPYASLDIAYDGHRFYLIEFQCMHFGTLTVEDSIRYYINNDGNWESVETASIIEEVFVEAVITYLKRKGLYA